MKRSARRYPASGIPCSGIEQPRHSASRQNDHPPSAVGIEVDRIAQLKRGGIVNLELVSCAVNVQVFARARQPEAETRSAVKLLLAHEPVRGQIKYPEFRALVALTAAHGDRITGLAVWRYMQSHHAGGGRADGSEIERAVGEIEPRDSEDLSAHRRVARIEDTH